MSAINYLYNSKADISEYKINDCVIIPVWKVNIGPSDSLNVIGVIVDQGNNMNRVWN